jgi:hypothetical protein
MILLPRETWARATTTETKPVRLRLLKYLANELSI